MDRLLNRLTVALIMAVSLSAAGIPPLAPRPAVPQARTPFQLAPESQVDLNLILAVDSSGSVDDERWELQKQGYADAFRSPKVMDAIKAGDKQQIAVSMMQWTGPTLHVVMVPWMVIKDPASAELFAAAVTTAPRQIFGGGTSISGAIDYSVLMFKGAPYKAERQVIDISGDGSNNLGRSVEQARDEALQLGVRINGLPILLLEHDLDQYYRESVIGGPGAFVIPVKNYDVFAESILRKLITEISQDQRPKRQLGQLKRTPFTLASK
jgi:uncharacterized protein DUF1194